LAGYWEVPVKEKIYEQIDNELKQVSRMETTVTIIAIVVTFILFGVSYAFANSSVGYTYTLGGYEAATISLKAYAVAALFLSLIAILVIDLYSIFAIHNNMTKRAKLAEGLTTLYQEEGPTSYSPVDMSAVYKTRGNVFTVIIATVGLISFIIPLIIFINRIVEEL
jgi:hypothetical protein